MRIMVFDVPADHGGALTILNEYYTRAIKDVNNSYFFVVSKPALKEINNVKILRFPWIKKSWFHRWFFDYLVAPNLVKKFNIELVYSLQNVTIPNINTRQILYLHQALPFIEQRFSIFEEPLFWIYQNVIGKIIIQSIRKADQVIVQTKWMKSACVKRAKALPEKILVSPPRVNEKINGYFQSTEENRRTFFYPSSGFTYKNHKVIVDAVSLLKKRNVEDFKVIFTLTGNENAHISKLYIRIIKDELPIQFVGTLSRQAVFEFYKKSVLLFPSTIETFGLPLLEARLHGAPVVASDMPFSHEILDGYEKAVFFRSDDSILLAQLMRRMMNEN